MLHDCNSNIQNVNSISSIYKDSFSKLNNHVSLFVVTDIII